LLLQNISELLRIPDKEKERQHSIELGLKFFVNAKKNKELYEDALEELLKAESLMKQDYFVLHRIGCIYLYVEKFLNPEKALDYFQRAAKYASVESDSKAARLVNVLNNSLNSKDKNVEKQIGLLAADSYEKAAFASYLLGRFDEAVQHQSNAFKFNNTSENRFILSKYQVRSKNIKEAIKNLDKSIDQNPTFAIAVFKEIDLINEPEVIKLINSKNDNIDKKIKELSDRWRLIESTKATKVIKDLNVLLKKSYEVKIENYYHFEQELKSTSKSTESLKIKIDEYINLIEKTNFCTFDSVKIKSIIQELYQAKYLPFDKMKIIFERIVNIIEKDKLQIGSIYEGGIVFYIDKTGKHGLVCAEKDFGFAIWGLEKSIGASGNGIADGTGIENTTRIHKLASRSGIFNLNKMQTAARLCIESNHNNYSDWYLPTKNELNLLWTNRKYIGGLKKDCYWSSTEESESYAWGQYFAKNNYWGYENGDQSSQKKNVTFNFNGFSSVKGINRNYVRAIRAF
jgi:tetratricopeptide (TPR) repeat protein